MHTDAASERAISDRVTTVDQLREIYDAPLPRALQKQLDHLDAHCRDFIARSPFALLATTDGAGNCDASPKGGPPGFARVLDEHHLAIPDAKGNRRLDSLTNLLSNPGAGLLFLIPGMGEALRVNGDAALTRDPQLLDELATGGAAPQLAIIVRVRAAYLHCAKCLIRSQLWKPESWPDPAQLPSSAQIFGDHMALGNGAEDAEQMLRESYRDRL